MNGFGSDDAGPFVWIHTPRGTLKAHSGLVVILCLDGTLECCSGSVFDILYAECVGTGNHEAEQMIELLKGVQ